MLTERTIFSICEVLPNATLQVRLADQILDGEVVCVHLDPEEAILTPVGAP